VTDPREDAENIGVIPKAKPCPECAQGKCGNCTLSVLTDADTFEQCPCMIGGHR
jgi:hypothetical protein